MPIIKIHNIETDEHIEREMTAEEILELKAEQEFFQKKAEELEAAKATAEAKLAALGLTADDLKALGLGGN